MKERDFTMRLCGHDVPVRYSDPGNWEATGMGRSNSLRGEIELSTKLTDVTRPSTFLHETIHLLLDFQGLNKASSDEIVVNALANGLLAWMKDNPRVVAELAGL